MASLLLAVGISQYQSDKLTDLSVCDQDAQVVAAAFERIAGDQLKQRLLVNEQATKEQIRAGIAWLAQTAQQGDLVIFYFSGHGATNRDDSSDEPDAAEEFLCPHDCATTPGLATFIRDDELYKWLGAVSRKTDKVAVILDACHSGTAVMAAQRATPKEIPPEIVRAVIGKNGSSKSSKRASTIAKKVPGQLLLAGCQDHERAYILEGAPNSLLTVYLLQGLERPEITTFQELYQHVSQLVVERSEQQGLQQNPNLIDGTDGKLALRI